MDSKVSLCSAHGEIKLPLVDNFNCLKQKAVCTPQQCDTRRRIEAAAFARGALAVTIITIMTSCKEKSCSSKTPPPLLRMKTFSNCDKTSSLCLLHE